MFLPPRPDLTHLPSVICDYIEALETEIERLRPRPKERTLKIPTSRATPVAVDEDVALLPPLIAEEPPTTINVISLSRSGAAKRTLRHLYMRQHRGGMGIFDLDTPPEDQVALLVLAEASQSLLLFTNLARTFRLPVNLIPETEIRARGQSITAKMNLQNGEYFVAALPDEARGAIALVSRDGFVRYLRHHVFGEYMKPGTAMFDTKRNGDLVGICRTSGDADILIVSRHGKGIRFSEKLVSPQGGPGIRLEAGDVAVGVVSTHEEGRVFLADAEGRGTTRLMAGFSANKSVGGGGKIIMNSNTLVGAAAIEDGADILMISRLSKIIRFMANEVPIKESAVQGVNCMTLRGDEVTTLIAPVIAA